MCTCSTACPESSFRALKEIDSQRRLAASEAALAEAQSMQRAILESTSDMIWSVNPRDFGLLTFNHALRNYFRKHRGIALHVGQRPDDLFQDSEYIDLWKSFYRKSLASGAFTTEYTVFAGNVTLLLTLNVLTREGVVFGISVFGKDITERKSAENAMVRYQLISQHARDPLMLIALDGQIVEANQAAVDLYGYSREELLKLNLKQLRLDHDQKALRNQMERALTEGVLFESLHARKDGTEVTVEVSSRGVMVEGRQMLLSVIRDITDRKRAEATLRESEAKLRAIFEGSMDAIGVAKDGLQVFANASYLKLYGFRNIEELAGTPVLDNIAPSHRQQILGFALDRAAGRPVATFYETRCLKTDGTEFDAEVSVSTYQLGGETYTVGSIRDITDRKRARTALARDEAELTAIYDHAPVMMLLISNDLKVLRMNQAALEFSGKTHESAVGTPPGEMLGCLHALDDPRGCGFGPDCASCPLRVHVLDTFKTGTTHRRIETRPRFVRGREVLDVTLLASTAQVAIESDVLVLLCLEDISQQKLAEQHVREQAALLDVTRDAIMVLDSDDLVTYWNRSAERIYGFSAAEALGHKAGDLFPAVDPSEKETIKRAIWEHGEWMGEIRRVGKADKALRIQRRVNLLRDRNGDPRGVLLVDTDITEAKRVEEQFLRAQRLDSLGSLASGVAHDLNNVFTPIMMSIEMLDALTHETHEREMVQLLADSTRRGTDIVRQLLLFSRGSDSPRSEVNATLVIRELRRMVVETFPKNIRLSTQAPADIWPIRGDQTQLHQVLLNLCINARDAMPQGGRLTVGAENVHVDDKFASCQLNAKPGPHVLIRVADTGTGIPPEAIEKIFDPFFTTKPIGEGTGLGLATALGIVRSHDGFITVKSAPGAGSEFSVYLPAMASTAGTSADQTARQNRRGNGELVLVVDDEANIRTMVQRTLNNHGYETAGVSDGAEALKFVAGNGTNVRLVVTDLIMPNADGMQLVRELRHLHPQLPIVTISGTQGHRAEFEKLPPPRIRYLSKPFSIDDLLAVVHEALAEAATPQTPPSIPPSA
jgi:PAS domain S-box-containing protein